MGVVADLGTHVDGGKGTKGMEKDVVVGESSEWGDKGGGVVDNVSMEWDEVEEVLLYEFFLWVPKLLVVLVDNCILVWVAVGSSGAGRGGKELGKEGGSNRVRYWFDGKRWERSGCLRSGGMGRQFSMDQGKENGLREGLDCNVVKGDVVAEVMTKVGVDKGILSGGNWWTVLLLLKLGNGLVDETKESFGSGEIGGRGADIIGGGLWDDGGVGQWVDQQDAG